MNFTEALIHLRDDLRNWVAVNLKRKVDKEVGKSLSSNDFTDEEKEKLKNIQKGAIKYVHPNYVPKEQGLYLISVDETGHVSTAKKVLKNDITNLGIPEKNTTYVLKKKGSKIILQGSDGSESYVYDDSFL